MIWLKLISAFFQVNYRNYITLNLATAHPHYDDEGNAYNMGTALMGLGLPKYVIFKIPAEASGMRTNAPGEGPKHDLDLCRLWPWKASYVQKLFPKMYKPIRHRVTVCVHI